jgi:hypothetical protein
MTTTRRAVLTALAGASALAIPAVARALPPGQGDAELFALQDAIEASIVADLLAMGGAEPAS